MAPIASVAKQADPTLVPRARRYERDAVAELCDRNLPLLWRLCLAVTGDPETAESVVDAALQRALDGLEDFQGDGPGFDVWLLRMAATGCARHRPGGSGVQGGLARLSNFDFELVVLRCLGEVDCEHLSPALSAPVPNLRAWLVSALRELDGRAGSGWGDDLRPFDKAIDEVVQGAEPESAAADLAAPHDAASLLAVVVRVRALIGDPLPDDVALRLRTRLLAGVAEKRAQWVWRHHPGGATVPGVERRRYPSRRGTLVALALAAVLAVMVGGVLALLSSFADPDSFLYPLKQASESVLMALSLDPVGRAELEVKLARTRELEAEDMAARGEGALAVQAMQQRYQLLRAAAQDLASVPLASRDASWRQARQQFFAEEDRQVTLVAQELAQHHERQGVQEVNQIVASYEAQSQSLDRELGRKTAPHPLAPTSPPAPSQPSF